MSNARRTTWLESRIHPDRGTRRRDLIALFATGEVALYLGLTIDRPVALVLKSISHPGLSRVMDHITELGEAQGWIIIVVLLALACHLAAKGTAWLSKQDRFQLWRNRALFVLASLAVSGILLNLLKFVIGRLRPRALFSEGIYGLHPFNTDLGLNGFPSGHTQTVWALATSIALFAPRWRPLLFTVAVIVSLTRITLTSHYVGDVLGGVALAAWVTWWLSTRVFDPATGQWLARWPSRHKLHSQKETGG